MANYTAYGREGDWGATPPVPFYSPPAFNSPAGTGGAANYTRYQMGGIDAPIAIATYTPAGGYGGALAAQPPTANDGAPALSYYSTPTGIPSPYYTPPPAPTPQPTPAAGSPAALQPVSLVPFSGGGDTAAPSPYALQAPSTPTAPGPTAPPSPAIEQHTVTAQASPQPTNQALPAWAQGTGGYAINNTGVVPQTVISPNVGQDVSGELSNLTAQLAGETPALTPFGMAVPGYQPPGARSSGGGASGGGSSGGAAPKPPQQQQQPVQRQNPISVVLQNIFGQNPLARSAGGLVPTVTAGGRTVYVPATAAGGGNGMDVSGPGNTPAGGVYNGGVANSLFAPASTNIWLPLLVGGVLLYAATQ